MAVLNTSSVTSFVMSSVITIKYRQGYNSVVLVLRYSYILTGHGKVSKHEIKSVEF